jgi:hypothetical protein
MTSRHCWRAAVMFAAVVPFVGSCGGASAPAPSAPGPIPTNPTPTPNQLGVTTKCGGPFHPGQYVGLACVVSVQDTPNNPTQGVYVDRSIFGGPAQSGVVKCTACGSSWIFDLDISIPANMAPGVKTFAVAAVYRDGNRVETTASIEIVGPPSQVTVSAKRL